MGKSIPKPQWAKDLEESEEFYHLGYWLEDQFEGRFTWTEEETANV
jgi:hypothetical protein